MNDSKERKIVRASRLGLIFVMAVALVPLGLAYVLYYRLQGGIPRAMTNHGELLKPVVDEGTLSLWNSAGKRVQLKHSWRLMLITGPRCEQDCQQALRQLRALQILLGKDSDRVTRTLAMKISAVDREFHAGNSVAAGIVKRYPGLELLTAETLPLTRGLYIIDPLGNIILRYPYSDVGKPVLTDLKKLLEVSQIG